jgi:hypothetical protein
MSTWGDPPEPRADEHKPRTYVTEVWCPPAGDAVVRMHSRMTEPEPEPEIEAGS